MSAKSTSKNQYLKLDIDAMLEDVFGDSAFIGISTALAPHRLCWLLNKYFCICFVRKPEMDICMIKKEKKAGSTSEKTYWHSVFEYPIPHSETRHLIYKLHHDKSLLLPEIKQMEYLWLIQTASCQQTASWLLGHLHRMAEIQHAVLLQPRTLKNIQNLLL
jgi:hypothetical protein